MRILLSGGIKTQNIVSGIDKKFKASGDDFLVIEYMDDIMDIFSRGDYFDKAVITEQSITREYAITDESVIRRKINQFALNMVNLPKKYSYVFLTQTEQMAEMIHEEILPILNESAVVVKEPPYSVNFFVSIIVTDVNQLPPEIVFTPTLDIPDDLFDNDAEAELMDGMEGDDTEQYVSKEITKDFDTELFGPDIDKVKPVKNVLTLDNHNDILDIPEELKGTYEDEIEIEPEEEPEEVIIEEEPEEEMYMPNSSFGPIIDKQSDSSTLEFTNINPIKKSSELPDYDIGDEEPEYTSQPDTGFIPGFDSDTDSTNSDMNTEYVGDTDMYNPDTSFDPYDTANTQGFNNGFGEDTYGDDVYDPNNSMAGFDPGVYGEEDTDKDYQDSMNEQIYDNQGPDGFNTQDYDTQSQLDAAAALGAGALAGAGMLAAEMQTQQEVASGKKKGLLSKIKNSGANAVASTLNVNKQSNNLPTIKGKLNPDQIKKALKPFAARGNTIVVTGCGGCGTSTVAYNLANIVTQLGYTVLLVDMDTEGRTQSYISKDNYESMEPDGANLMSAVNSSNGIGTHISVVKQGFHLLTMGLGTDTAPVNELIHKEKINRFVNLTKTSHNFIIYDIPFKDATGFLSDITYMADNLVLVTDASNWGITKTMLSVCNIASDDMQDTVFSRAQLVFNKYRNLYRVLGRKVKTCVDITKVMDQKVLELVGEDPGFHFEDLHIAGIINDDPDFENGWFEEVQYSDTKKGQEIFLELIEHIVLKK